MKYLLLLFLLTGCRDTCTTTRESIDPGIPQVNWRQPIPQHKPCDWYDRQAQYYRLLGLSWSDAAPIGVGRDHDYWAYQKVSNDYDALSDRYQAENDKCDQ